MSNTNEYEEEVILVDKHDVEQGTMEKMEAHKNGGTLHRAFSVFVFNTKVNYFFKEERCISTIAVGFGLTHVAATQDQAKLLEKLATED